MKIVLNSVQARGLADFFLDIAKGFVLGGIGSALIVPFQLKYVTGILSGILAMVCIKMALALLEDLDK